MKRYTYAVFFKTKRGKEVWARTNNKRQALRFARLHSGYVTALDYHSGKGAWDAPTFKACSTLVADFTEDHVPTQVYHGAMPAVDTWFELDRPAGQ